MDVFLMVVCFVITLLVLLLISYYLCDLLKFCDENRIIKEECNLMVDRYSLFVTPKKILEPIEKNNKIIKRDKEEIEKKYKRYWRIFCFLLVLAIVHVTVWIWMLCNIFSNINNIDDMLAVRSAFVIVEIVLFYNIYLTPLFEMLKLPKLAAYGPKMWDAMQYFCDKTTRVMGVVFEFLISMAILVLFLKFFKYLGIDDSFWLLLIFFLVYQYVILRILAKVLKRIVFRISFFEKYRDEKFEKNMYMHLKSTTFIGVILVNAIALGNNQGDKTVWKAIGIVFLLDTYIEQRFTKKYD